MNAISTNIDVDKYLSIKRIILLSIAVTMAYYFLFTLNHYFSRPTFDNQEAEQVMDEGDDDANAMQFSDVRTNANERERDFFESPEAATKDFYK